MIKYSLIFLGFLLFLFDCTVSYQNRNTLIEKRIIDLPNVEGRIDHMSIDLNSDKLFVAALGNGSIEIVDLISGKDIHSIRGFEEPQGVLYYPGNNLLFVTSAGDGTCKIFDAADSRLVKSIQLGDDADNIRFDKKRDKVFVGYGSGGIAVIDPAEMKLMYKIDLPAHPESFQIDETRGLLYVNIPNAGQIDIIDINTEKVIEKVSLKVKGNFPMALDTTHQVIYIGSRNPSKLVLFDTKSLTIISEYKISGDADDIYYDPADSLVFVSCGSGNLDIFRHKAEDEISLIESIKTSPGARTSLYVPGINEIFLAARKYEGNNARIAEYLIQPRTKAYRK